MNFPPDFVRELKERAGNVCECGRADCHPGSGRCHAELIEGPMEGRWLPVATGDQITFPPRAVNYIALCVPCIVPRTGTRKAG